MDLPGGMLLVEGLEREGKKCTLSPQSEANGWFDRGWDGSNAVHATPISFLRCRARLSFLDSAVGG